MTDHIVTRLLLHRHYQLQCFPWLPKFKQTDTCCDTSNNCKWKMQRENQRVGGEIGGEVEYKGKCKLPYSGGRPLAKSVFYGLFLCNIEECTITFMFINIIVECGGNKRGGQILGSGGAKAK
ncbi:hypothetical protein V6N13_024240 [Hibiscus sabdariffa]|uniref:Uncharacterized protein n=2 Tax=Hibiscus sabdariffa TaxID=183260 RepID=A0ABR2BYI0_9ROSI